MKESSDLRENNMSYLGLTEQQMDRHNQLMAQKMSEWPQELLNFLQAQSKDKPFSGDLLATIVADWIKEQ